MAERSDSDYESDVNGDDMEVDEQLPVAEATEEENEIKLARQTALRKIQEEAQENGEGECASADRQLAYLMTQSEVFSHFITDGDGTSDAIASTDKRKSKSKKSIGGLGGGVGRTRMSEEAEDRRLMKLAQSKGKDVSRVTEQPRTIAGNRSFHVTCTLHFPY